MSERFAIDVVALHLAVNLMRMRDGLNGRDVARAAGVTPATISRIEHEHTISAANFLGVCKWIGIDPYVFLVDMSAEAGRAKADVSRETPKRGEISQLKSPEAAA